MCGSPNMTAFAFTSEKINVFALADLMEEKGEPYVPLYTPVYYIMIVEWKMERARRCIHCTILPSHTVEVLRMCVYCM